MKLNPHPSGQMKMNRPRLDGELPPGMAMASYYLDSLDRDDLDYFSDPRAFSQAPYGGRRAVTLRGPSGELIELLEFKMRKSDSP